MTKPVFVIDLAEGAQSSLEAHLPLALATTEGCFHHEQNVRMPFGIYNISVHRVSDKLIRLCKRLESYFSVGRVAAPQEPANDDLMQEVIDYIELTLYAAAEHFDDVDWIASGFFSDGARREKNPAYKALQKQMKQNKRFVSAAANAIKHQQSRIRIYSVDYAQGTSAGSLHGYFMEGVEAGVVGPSSTFHRNQEVFSVTTLVWEVLFFLLQSSHDLAKFLKAVSMRMIEGPIRVQCNIFSQAVAAAARLPTYTFGEEHPFTRATLRLSSSDNNSEILDSSLHGSITKQWSKTIPLSFGSHVSRFAGDGVTREFRLVQPKMISLQHWS